MGKYLFIFEVLMMLLPMQINAQNESNLRKANLKIEKYKSDKTNELVLNFQDSTYTYKERSILEEGDDFLYEKDSRGKFFLQNDTITFVSQMPSEIDINDNWSTVTEFLPIYQVKEQIDKDLVKIYFDNIAEPQYYSAYEYKNGKMYPLKIKEYKILDNNDWLIYENDATPLIHYLLIEKPCSNKLLLLNPINEEKNESFYFDLERITYQSFHFFTRAYWSYQDFTGLKFVISGNALKLIDDNRLNRYMNSIIENAFIKQ